MKTLFTALIFLTSINILKAQVNQEWIARYNGTGNSTDFSSAIEVDGFGNVYVTGESRSSSVSGTSYDYLTIKYNSSGVQQWEQRYNGSGNSSDRARAIVLDGFGNVYVTGESWGASGALWDYATIKYNSSGVQQWIQRYNPGNRDDKATSIALDSLGNVYVTGWSSILGSPSFIDYATIKYNSSGDSVWVQRYNGPDNGVDESTSIAIDGSGNVYVTGKSLGTELNYDIATIKYNSSGAQQWVARYSGPSDDVANSITVDGLGNVYVTGNQNNVFSDYTTIKYNSSGVQLWAQSYDRGLYDAANSIVVDGSGNVYVTGESYGSFDADFATIKYNSSGIQQWAQIYNGPGNNYDVAYSIVLDVAGNVYVGGGSIAVGSGPDYAAIKYNSLGDSVWVQRYNGPGNSNDYVYSIAVDGSGNVYVTGGSTGIGSLYDYATIKYSQTIGINQISSLIPDQLRLNQNYPNPFNPTTNIEFSIPKQSNAKITVYDSQGKEVAALLNERLSAGSYRVDFDGTGYSSGVYFYKLETEDFVQTKSMVLLK